MFINIRLNKLFKVFFIITSIILLFIFIISMYKIFYKSINKTDEINSSDITEISSNNYTNVLKAVHDDLDSYIGKTVNFTGYVYRIFDFTDTQFVLARNMIISSDNKAVVVGFLCNYKDAMSFKDNSWINITGTITKGNYHGDIPIIEIKEIKEAERPKDEFVYPPDESFIPTNSIL